MKRAKVLEQRWWEESGQANLGAQHFQSSMWAKSMAARFHDDWRDRSDNNTTLNAGDGFADLLGKIAGQSVFPGDDDRKG